jgi:hypothetical protein
MRRWVRWWTVAGVLVLAAVTAGQAAAVGIPIVEGGVVRLSPFGNGPDGKRAAPVYAGTLRLDAQLCQEPEKIAPLFKEPLQCLADTGQFLLANVGVEVLVYDNQYGGGLGAAPGLSLNLDLQGVPGKIGFCWAPTSEWDAGWYAGMTLFSVGEQAAGQAMLDPLPADRTGMPVFNKGK